MIGNRDVNSISKFPQAHERRARQSIVTILLLATTALGAKAGFVTLWVIIASCVIKVALQLEFGRHAINSGETSMEALNKLPGPRFGRFPACSHEERHNFSVEGYVYKGVKPRLSREAII